MPQFIDVKVAHCIAAKVTKSNDKSGKMLRIEASCGKLRMLTKVLKMATTANKFCPRYGFKKGIITIAADHDQLVRKLTLVIQNMYAAIQTRKPSLNRTDGAPLCNKLWDPILPEIANSFKPRPTGITFPRR